MMDAVEMNFDGLVGPTHHYAGLSYGNLASSQARGRVSSPRLAALQGLAKAKGLFDLGLSQGIFPPLLRPNFGLTRSLGYVGSDAELVQCLGQEDRALLGMCYSASSMWCANAATVSAGADCADGRVHFTASNLISQLHRSIEGADTARMLKLIFHDEQLFGVHDPLPGAMGLCDEGAANHMRFCGGHGGLGIDFFVYGRAFGEGADAGPRKYPARQSLESGRAIARRHGLDAGRVLFVQQNPEVIDAGVFHNDVISVGHLNVLLYHERAFVGGDEKVDALSGLYEQVVGGAFYGIKIPESVLSVRDAVGSYLFNSQLVSVEAGRMVLVCPGRCRQFKGAMDAIDLILNGDNPVKEVMFFDLHESMDNGGGPACLRLRVVLNQKQRAGVHPGAVLTRGRYDDLVSWIKRYYREELRLEDLCDVNFIGEVRQAYDALEKLLGIEGLYR